MENEQDTGDGTVQDCAKEVNKLGPQNTGAGGWRMTRCWRWNWSQRMENNDNMLEPELEPEDGEQ